jgi:hypothetical protein
MKQNKTTKTNKEKRVDIEGKHRAEGPMRSLST